MILKTTFLSRLRPKGKFNIEEPLLFELDHREHENHDDVKIIDDPYYTYILVKIDESTIDQITDLDWNYIATQPKGKSIPLWRIVKPRVIAYLREEIIDSLI